MLVGIVWPLILFVYLFSRYKKGKQKELPPFKGRLEILDTFILFSIFIVYIYLVTGMGKKEPELEGPPSCISLLPQKSKILLIIFMFIFSALTFLASAKPFGESLLVISSNIAKSMNFDPELANFLMVQWVAPIASESPEILVVIIFA